MASIVRRIRKLGGRFRRFITNTRKKQVVIPYLTELTPHIDPQQNSVEIASKGKLHSFLPNDETAVVKPKNIEEKSKSDDTKHRADDNSINDGFDGTNSPPHAEDKDIVESKIRNSEAENQKQIVEDSNKLLQEEDHFDEDIESMKSQGDSKIEIIPENIDRSIEDCMDKENSEIVEFSDITKDPKADKEMEIADEAAETVKYTDECCKIEIIRDNIDWSLLDDMKEEFKNKYSEHHAKKQNFEEKYSSAAKDTTKKQNVAERLMSQNDCQIELNLMDSIEEVLNVFKSNIKEALFMDAETWRSGLDTFLQNSDEFLAPHYREFLHTIEHLQFNEIQFENIIRQAIEGRNAPTQNQDPNRKLETLDQDEDTHVLNFGCKSGDEE